MVGPTLESKDSLEDFEVHLLERGIVFRVEDPRHTPVPQDFNHLGLQHADLQAERGGCHTAWGWTEPVEACPHESDPSIDLNHELIFLVDNAADV